MRVNRSISIILLATLALVSLIENPGNTLEKKTEIYPLKTFKVISENIKNKCSKLSEPELTKCVSNIIAKDKKPDVLRRSIGADSGAAILRNLAQAVVRDVEAIATSEKKRPDSTTLEKATKNIPNGAVSAYFDKKSQSIKLVIPLAEAGVVVLVQVADIKIVGGRAVIIGKDVFGRSLAENSR